MCDVHSCRTSERKPRNIVVLLSFSIDTVRQSRSVPDLTIARTVLVHVEVWHGWRREVCVTMTAT
jgi:hypothetical protein